MSAGVTCSQVSNFVAKVHDFATSFGPQIHYIKKVPIWRVCRVPGILCIFTVMVSRTPFLKTKMSVEKSIPIAMPVMTTM